MMKNLLLLFVTIFAFTAVNGQTIEELKSQKAAKEAQLADLEGKVSALKGEVDGLTKQIEGVDKWKLGTFGTIGLNFSQFNNWFGSANPDVYSSTLGFSGNAFANLNEDKYFWRNSGNLNIAKTKLALTEDEKEDKEYETTADAINVSSLFGYKLSEKLAISALGEYRSTILDNFNDPGFLDLGLGATWTPMADLVVVFHPLNYNIVFASDDNTYESSPGCKIVADYSKALQKGISWRSNLSAFISYSETSNYSNWTWVNGLSATIWKGLGVGFDLGLRNNKQEGYNNYLSQNPDETPDIFSIDDLKSDDNPLQTYWVLGFTFKL